jgi:hypothetical protein
VAIQQGFFKNAGGGAPQNNAPSSGSGVSVESAVDPMTGQRLDYRAPQVSPRLSTDGSLNGPVHSCKDGSVRVTGTNEREYREAAAAASGIHPGGSAGYGLPSDVDRFVTSGRIPADSNYHATTVVGGAAADHDLVLRRGGADDQTNTGDSGGRTIL